MELYAYTGDVKKLKTIGYQFQKLFALNHKSYHKDDIFMFVACKMVVEYGTLRKNHQVAFIDFILANADKPKEFWVSDKVYPKITFDDMPNYHLSHFGNVHGDREMFELKHAHIVEFGRIMDLEKAGDLDKERAEEMMDLTIEKMEGSRDPFSFGWDRIQAILELNKLHPLEKILDSGFI